MQRFWCNQSFCMKCRNSKYFQNIKIKIFKFNYVIEIVAHTIFNTNVLKLIIFHFYVAGTAISFLVLHNDNK